MSEELSKLASRYERLSLLYQVSNVIHSTLDSQEALQLIVSEAVRVMRASSGSLVLINPTSNFLEIHAAQNLSSTARKLKLRVGEGVTGWVAQTGKALERIVVQIADEGFQEVLDGEKARDAPVLVDDDGHGPSVLAHVRQRLEDAQLEGRLALAG